MANKKPKMPNNFQCIECGGQPQLVSGDKIYPHRADLHAKSFYKCACSAYCGCHPRTDIPLGYPCGPETRKARMAAHNAIDPIWRDKLARRSDVYRQMAERLGIPADEMHVGMMTQERAYEAARVAQGYRKELELEARENNAIIKAAQPKAASPFEALKNFNKPA